LIAEKFPDVGNIERIDLIGVNVISQKKLLLLLFRIMQGGYFEKHGGKILGTYEIYATSD